MAPIVANSQLPAPKGERDEFDGNAVAVRVKSEQAHGRPAATKSSVFSHKSKVDIVTKWVGTG